MTPFLQSHSLYDGEASTVSPTRNPRISSEEPAAALVPGAAAGADAPACVPLAPDGQTGEMDDYKRHANPHRGG